LIIICHCVEGYTGKNCSVNIDDCSPNPCQNGATCNDRVADYQCDCPNGFRGRNCSENINDCAPDPCVKDTCFDEINDYTCICETGY
uniref:EGF-like domain-containing protein n=1 Tax=Amphimedon queenslandica TaxID=400682 RepID=A0A1X7T6V2_AMPQE